MSTYNEAGRRIDVRRRQYTRYDLETLLDIVFHHLGGPEAPGLCPDHYTAAIVGTSR